MILELVFNRDIKKSWAAYSHQIERVKLIDAIRGRLGFWALYDMYNPYMKLTVNS